MRQTRREPQDTSVDDPAVRKMLVSHIHCGEPMPLVQSNGTPRDGSGTEETEEGAVTYRCSCGFTCDHARG
jgi:hypothetical protein